MKKKLVTRLFLSGLLVTSLAAMSGCKKKANSSNSNDPSVTIPPSGPTSNTPDTSIPGSSNTSVAPQKTAFLTPTNVKIIDNILSFDAQEGATNGYTVKFYLQGQEQNFSTFVIEDNMVDLSSEELGAVLPRGIVFFQVHVNATEEHYVSPYSNPVSLLYGVHDNLVEIFMNKVDELEIVTADSLELLNECKAAYAALDDVDLLDERVNEYVEKLAQKEAVYLGVLFTDITLVHEDEKTNEWIDAINKVKEFYLAMIDKNNSAISEYLKTAVSYSYEYRTYAISSDENVTIVDLTAKNFLDDEVDVDGLKAQHADEMMDLTFDNGVYYVRHTTDFELFLEDTKIATISYHTSLDTIVETIEGQKVLKFNCSGSVDEFIVQVFNTQDIKLIEDTPIVTAMPILNFTSSLDAISMKELAKALDEFNLVNQNISLVFSVKRGGVESPIYVDSSYLNIILGESSDKLSTPHEIINQPIYFTENGGIEYKWEILTQNEEYNYNLTKGIQFDFYVGDNFDDHTEILSSVLVTKPGYLEYEAIMSQFKLDRVSVTEPLHAVAKMVRSDNSPLLDSDYVEVQGSYNYVVDYRLSRYGSNNFSIDQGNGRLVWPWEIFLENNVEYQFIKNAEVLVFDESVVDENEGEPLTSFIIDFEGGDRFTYKDKIEEVLSYANLSSGNYRFSMRLIAKEDSGFEDSELYPITESYYYETISLADINVAKGCDAYASYGNGSAAADGNMGTRWINGTNDIETGWLIIDLGEIRSLRMVKVFWEGAYAKDYDIFLEDEIDVNSFDGDTTEMEAIASVRDRDSYQREDEFNVDNASGRYLIISCISRGTGYAYSIFEVEAYMEV